MCVYIYIYVYMENNCAYTLNKLEINKFKRTQ